MSLLYFSGMVFNPDHVIHVRCMRSREYTGKWACRITFINDKEIHWTFTTEAEARQKLQDFMKTTGCLILEEV